MLRTAGSTRLELTPVSRDADKTGMTAATERTIKTLGYAWIAGTCASAFLGWLLVPSALPVHYLTPVVVAGPFVGIVAGGILVLTLRSA